ncbi:hypothetical protein AVEN_41977-1 [Araneus ventricosus]|uniref:PiggyBac transposable element-derived protein domain-containing protein n=1 Tax=Araneus ventricosus TaxID=182803 RepID=A0A4Y2WCH1_ARAVE|nr:hypothetical protein AVEN_41977-1 [Araneus ventricosus]
MFGFNVLVLYIPKAKKYVILVSSLHDDKAIDPESREQSKPDMVVFYNFNKGGIDTEDQMCITYSGNRILNRWQTVKFTMLNMSGISSQVIFLGNQQESTH